ncbi:hypothetical protein D917_06678 [Trichinella nativa]|uniref:Uncharacterized protein n=1 Tax=Trichinella nativa TaxID=6335 RepID=A0A1Y3ERK6_9BILA|nr:hypothetical protein D917_06678 [Trichinella nativa]
MQNESLKTENGTYRKRLNMQPNRPKGHHHSRWDAVAELARVIVGLGTNMTVNIEAALGKYGSVGNGGAVPPRPVRNLLFNCDHLPCTADGQLLQKIKAMVEKVNEAKGYKKIKMTISSFQSRNQVSMEKRSFSNTNDRISQATTVELYHRPCKRRNTNRPKLSTTRLAISQGQVNFSHESNLSPTRTMVHVFPPFRG